MKEIKPFENRIWLSSPTMHGEELKYMTFDVTVNSVRCEGGEALFIDT